MNIIKYILSIIILNGTLLASVARASNAVSPQAPNKITSEQLEQLTDLANEKKDIAILSKELGARMPGGFACIYSIIYCDRLEVDDRKAEAAHERAVREFGRLILVRLNGETRTAIKTRLAQKERARLAGIFAELAEWFEKGRGIGNMIIGSRARGIAAAHLAYLVVDMNYPLEEVTPLIERIQTGGIYEWWMRLVPSYEIEVPDVLAPVLRETRTERDIRMATLPLGLAMEKAVKKIVEEKGWKRIPDDKEMLRQIRNQLDFKVAIFFDDRTTFATDVSTLGLWDYYSLFPPDAHMSITKYVRLTAIFREKIGGFPMGPLPSNAYKNGKFNSFYGSLTGAAFYHAWEEFYKQPQFNKDYYKIDPATGRSYIDPKERTLSDKYFNMHDDSCARIIYEAVQQNQVGKRLYYDDPDYHNPTSQP
jgi:hypothetical protein